MVCPDFRPCAHSKLATSYNFGGLTIFGMLPQNVTLEKTCSTNSLIFIKPIIGTALAPLLMPASGEVRNDRNG
jgi:hypothetical protein